MERDKEPLKSVKTKSKVGYVGYVFKMLNRVPMFTGSEVVEEWL